MASDVKTSGLKQLKVDNWSTFFMQRLQLLFAKGDSCDLTLRFHTGQELKVHSLVLRTCTSHFDTLPREGDVIILPEVLSYFVVFPIINFMYSGKLEFKPELQPKLISIAKLLNITILLKLLMTQHKGDGSPGSTPRSSKPHAHTSAHDCCKTSHQFTRPTPHVNLFANFGLFHGKKLPFWRKRRPLARTEEEVGPMRFNWPENEPTDWILISSPSFSSLSYDAEPILKGITPKVEPEYIPTPQRRVIESRMITTNDSDDDDDRFDDHYSSEEERSSPPPPPLPPPPPPLQHRTPPATPPILKPILKTPTSEPSSAPPSKKVRFSLGPEEKENTANPADTPNTSQSQDSDNKNVTTPRTVTSEQPVVTSTQTVTYTQPIITTQTVNSNLHTAPVQSLQTPKTLQPVNIVQNTTNTASTHAKIIAEVLKKYPDLVKNKNVKLKISSPKPKTENGIVGSNEEKASYVVLRPALRAVDRSSLPPAPKITDPSIPPYVCDHCPDLRFDAYADFRKHVQEVHNGRLDVRICEHCGYKASKRNLLLYHLFTKHDVQPPSHMKFPKCPECTYIALSEGLLAKHMNNHQAREARDSAPKEFPCDICKVVLRSQASLNAHKITCKPGNEQRHIVCDLCKTPFRTNISLNSHLKDCQGKPEQTTTALFTDDGDQSVEMIEVPIIEAVNVEKGDHTLVQIPSGILLADNQNVALLPTSEADHLGGGIATSIGLTVALPQDQQALILLHGDNQEYIVPEFISGSFTTTAGNIAYTTSQNQVIYLNSNPGNGNEQDVIQLEEIKISQPTPSTSTAEDKKEEDAGLGSSGAQKEENQNISQSLIINVPGGLSADSALDQSGLILIDPNKDLEGTLVQTHVTTGGEESVANGNTGVLLNFTENETRTVKDKSLARDPLANDGSANIKSEEQGEEIKLMRRSDHVKAYSHVNFIKKEEKLSSEFKNTSTLVSSKLNSTTDTVKSPHNEQVSNVNSSQGSSVQHFSTVKERITDIPNDSSQKTDLIKQTDTDIGISAVSEKEEEINAILDKETNSAVATIVNEGKDKDPCHDEEKNKDMIVSTDDEKSKDMIITDESNVEAEQMQIEEAREDMIVDDYKDEVSAMDVEERSSMEVEEIIVDSKESKDDMEIEEIDKSSAERVDSLVKDWGFDDEDTEEIIDDPDCKPLRPDLDIPL